MRGYSRNRMMQMVLVAVILVGGMLGSVQAASITNYTYTGLAGNPNDWSDANNWTNQFGSTGVPNDSEERAIIPDGLGPTFINVPATLINGFVTGNTKVTLTSDLSLRRSADNTVGALIDIGTGGVEGTNLSGSLQESAVTIRGNVELSGTFRTSTVFPSIVGTPTFDVAVFDLPGDYGGTYAIGPGLSFLNANSLNIALINFTQNTTFNFTGTPNFNGGRPDWTLVACGDNQVRFHVGNQTLLGDALQLDGWPGGASRYGIITANGGTLDVNTLGVAFGFGVNGAAYVALTNATLAIRGSGTAYDNRSTNNVQYDVATGSTAVFDPTGGAMSVDTGSKDRGGDGLQTSDWDNNFAFGSVVIGSGDTITLVGDANIEGGGNNALYVAGTLSGAGTIAGGRNVYVKGGVSPGTSAGALNVIGSLFLMSNAVANIELNGLTAGTQYDFIDVNGSAVISNAVLDLSLGFSPPDQSTFTILDNDGSDPIAGYFVAADSTPLTEGAMWIDGGRFSISYLGGDGNDIVLTSFIPEPSVVLLLALGGLMLVRGRRER